MAVSSPLLDCQDGAARARGRVDIVHFTEATSTDEDGPYDVSLVEGSVTTPGDAVRIQRIRAQSRTLVTIGACASAGEFRHCATSPISRSSPRPCTHGPSTCRPSPHPRRSPTMSRVDFELRGCPIDRRPAARADLRTADRPQAQAFPRTACATNASCAAIPASWSRARDALPRPGDSGWLRRDLPQRSAAAAMAASDRWQLRIPARLPPSCCSSG